MRDLVILVVLAAVGGAAGISLGMLASRRLGAWDERRAGAEADPVPATRGSGPARNGDLSEDGGKSGD